MIPPRGTIYPPRVVKVDSALAIVDDRFADVTIGLHASSWRTCCDVWSSLRGIGDPPTFLPDRASCLLEDYLRRLVVFVID
jgi:hypothetical protein